jgi:hypothetical protein
LSRIIAATAKNVLADGDTHVSRQQFFFFKSFPCINKAFRRLGYDRPEVGSPECTPYQQSGASGRE